MKLLKLTAMTVIALSSSVAMANVKPAAVGVEVGTFGVGANVAWGVTDSVEVQAGWAGVPKVDRPFSFDTTTNSQINKLVKEFVGDDTVTKIKGDGHVQVKSHAPFVGVQLRPFQNWLTVGTGVAAVRQNVDFEITNKETNKFTIAGKEYTIEEGDKVSLNFKNRNHLSPYLTVGVRPNINNRFGLVAEVGAAYVGAYKADVKVQATENNYNNAQNLANATNGVNEYDQMAVDLYNELPDASVPVYPIVKLGATVRF